MSNTTKNILIGCTGSVATIKLESIVQELLSKLDKKVTIKIVLTAHAQHFTSKKDNTVNVFYYTDEDEWQVIAGVCSV